MSINAHTSAESETDVVAWRERRLAAAGVDRLTAHELAADCRFDLHQLITLIESGCPPDLAVRILAPIDEGMRPC
jgi:hypothetical protein